MSPAVPDVATGARPAGSPRTSILFGFLAAFVAALDLIRLLRADLLLSPEPSWAVPRLLLSLLVIGASAGAGVLAAGGFYFWSRGASAGARLEGLPLSRRTLGVLFVAALALGVFLRVAWLDRVPPVIWSDEIVPLRPSLALVGKLGELAEPIRMMPTDGTTLAVAGVGYLEAYRLMLVALGTTLFAVRLSGALAGMLSLVTAVLLARALLPRGGGTLAGLALAGLRWQLILGRFAWNALALAPIVDLATLLLIRARRRSSILAAAGAGLVAGIGAYVYLGAWIAAAALGAFLLWPRVEEGLRRRMGLALAFGLGFLVIASPILLRGAKVRASYFGRAADQNLFVDFHRTKSFLMPFFVVADSLQAPWLLPDPLRRQDLPMSRLGWILGIPVAVAFLRAFRLPREELSSLLFAHAGAAMAASSRWGFPGHPNGYRFLYLTTITAVAASAGTLWLIQRTGVSFRRAAALAAAGLLTIASVAGGVQALRWGESRDTFDAYVGRYTLFGRSALRWRREGSVVVEPRLLRSTIVIAAVLDFDLDPEYRRAERMFGASSRESGRAARCFRIGDRETKPRPGERPVEVIGDAWGRDYGIVLASRCGNPADSPDPPK